MSTFYFTVNPTSCFSQQNGTCYCHYNVNSKLNVYNCSSTSMNKLPSTVPKNTDGIIMDNTSITSLCDSSEFWKNISFLSFRGSSVNKICESFTTKLSEGKTLKVFNLKDNNLSHLPRSFEGLNTIEKILLDGNCFHCNCDMMWITWWLSNFTKSSKHNIVWDNRRVTCCTGMMVGQPIFLLDGEKLGCYPNKWTMWREITATIITVIILFSIVIFKMRKEIKFWMYLHFTPSSMDENLESLKDMRYDAFISYK